MSDRSVWRVWLRRRLVLAALASFALAGVLAIAAYAFRDNLSRYTMKPSREFDPARAPAAPDYTAAEGWVRLPTTTTGSADVFFIYPMIYYGGSRWNARPDDPEDMGRLEQDIIPLFAGPFSRGTNVFIPRYRQAGAYAFMTNAPSAQNARRLAYDDVARAFQNFLAARNGGRPFVVAAYGQGALHATRLLRDFVAKDEAVRARFVAAYLAEAALPEDLFKDYLSPLSLCADEYAIACVNVWQSATQEGRVDLPRTNSPVWLPDGGFDTTRGRTLACVNPLIWSVNGRAADKAINFGAAQIAPGGPDGVTLTPEATGADCWNGLLYVDERPAPLYGFAGPRYRDLFPDVENQFFENVRANLAVRIEAHRQASAPPPEDGTSQQSPDAQD